MKDKKAGGANYYMKEMRSGFFCRSLRLPKEVDEDKVNATHKDGILTLMMPHKEGSKHKKIEIH